MLHLFTRRKKLTMKEFLNSLNLGVAYSLLDFEQCYIPIVKLKPTNLLKDRYFFHSPELMKKHQLMLETRYHGYQYRIFYNNCFDLVALRLFHGEQHIFSYFVEEKLVSFGDNTQGVKLRLSGDIFSKAPENLPIYWKEEVLDFHEFLKNKIELKHQELIENLKNK